MNYYDGELKEGEPVDRLGRWEGKWHNEYEGKPQFHLPQVNPNLESQYGNTFLPPKDEPILLPLCGKTVDLRWLREQGHSVVCGVEGVHKAIEELREETLPELRRFDGTSDTVLWTTAEDGDGWFQQKDKSVISIVCEDFFEVSPSLFGDLDGLPFAAALDRGALVAVPPSSRAQYVAKLDSLLRPGGQLLLVTLGRDDEEGPPFCVCPDTVQSLFVNNNLTSNYDVRLVEEHPREIKGKAVTEYVFVLTKDH